MALNVSNGRIIYGRPPAENGQYTVATVAYYACDDGYVNIGNNSAICLSSGIWNGSDFICTGNKNK